MRAFSLSLMHLLAFIYLATAQLTCTSNLLIDDYSHYMMHKNSLNQYTSDDDTTMYLTVDVVNKTVSFNAVNGSYFYSNFGCEKAVSLGYNAIAFSITGPLEATFELELQTSAVCPVIAYTSYYYAVPIEMTDKPILVTVPLSLFTGANLNALNAIIFGGFTPGDWTIGSTELVCANIPTTSINGSITSNIKSPSTSTAASLTLGTTPSSSRKMTSTSNFTSHTISISSSTVSSRSTLSSFLAKTSSFKVSSSQVTPSTKTTASLTTTPPGSSCTGLLIDDFSSQYRLIFSSDNALLQPSSDDNTMEKVIVANNHVTLFPVDSHSYFYTSFGCLNATSIYGGIGLTISAPVHTVIAIEFRTSPTCMPANATTIELSSKELGWDFDATERFYTIPFIQFRGLDTGHLISLRFSGFRNVVTLGSIAFYCRATEVYEA